MTDPVACPRCSIADFPPIKDQWCPLCGYDRVVWPELDAAYRLRADKQSLDFLDVVEIRDMVKHGMPPNRLYKPRSGKDA